MTVPVPGSMAMRMVMALVVVGRRVGGEDRLEGRYRREGKARGDHAPEKRAPVATAWQEVRLTLVHGARRYQVPGCS
jgi:hypothetical protein